MDFSKMAKSLEQMASDVTDGVRYSRIRKYQFDITTYTLLFDEKTVAYLKDRTIEEFSKIKDKDLQDSLKKDIPYLSTNRKVSE